MDWCWRRGESGEGSVGSDEGKIEANFRIRGLVVREEIIKPEAEFN